MSRPPIYLEHDADAWRALIECARKAAGDLRCARPLGAAAKRAFKAVFPDQTPERRRSFNELVRLGALWPQMTHALRTKHAQQLRELARACAVAMGEEPPEDPRPAEAEAPLIAWRRCADIEG